MAKWNDAAHHPLKGKRQEAVNILVSIRLRRHIANTPPPIPVAPLGVVYSSRRSPSALTSPFNPLTWAPRSPAHSTEELRVGGERQRPREGRGKKRGRERLITPYITFIAPLRGVKLARRLIGLRTVQTPGRANKWAAAFSRGSHCSNSNQLLWVHCIQPRTLPRRRRRSL